MAGFYTEYFSTLLKGLGATAFKQRREFSRVINNLRKADHLLYKSIFEDVEKNHRVTRALREEERLIGKLKKSAENCYSILFNVSTEEIIALEEIKKILEEFEAFSKSVASLPKSVNTGQIKKVEREFALTIYKSLKKAEDEEREEYRQIELILNESEEKNHNKFMANIRLAFQRETSQTMLAKFAARMAIRKAKLNIQKLKTISIKIKAIRRRLTEKAKKDGSEKVIGELYGTIQDIKTYCNDAFYEMFLIMKRDTLLTLKVLLDLNNLKQFNEKWVDKKFMPRQQVEEKNGEIDELESKLSGDFHTIAQAFRIIISKIQKLEKEAEADASSL